MNYLHSPSKSYLPNIYLDIAKGDVAGTVHRHIFGHGTVGTTPIPIWDGGVAYTFPTVALTMTVASTSTDDDITGIGARTIYIEGLDTNYAVISESLNLDGTVGVTTANQYLRINTVLVTVAGSTNTAQGTISLTNGGTTYAQIVNGHNRSTSTIYTLEAGVTGYLLTGQAGVGQGKEISLEFYMKGTSNIPIIGHAADIYQSTYRYDFTCPLVVPEKTDLYVEASTSAGTVNVSSMYDIIVETN